MTNTAMMTSHSAEVDAYCEAKALADENKRYSAAKRAAYYKHPADRTSAEQELATAYVNDLSGMV